MWQKSLLVIAKNPELLGKLLEHLGSMPNIEMGTKGGKIFWDDLAEVDGWRLQQNKVFKNCRLLDPNDVRKAWGGESAMKKAFENIVKEIG